MMRRACLAGVVLALLLSGCRSYKAATVSGRITLDGKPLPNATVTFVPVTDAKDPPPSSIGTTGEDGRHSLVFETDGKEGAAVGKHKVIIAVGAQGTSSEATRTFHKQLPEQYNRKSKLECEVPPGGRSDADFDLKSK